MESKHGIKKFDQVLKRNFLPGSSDSSYAKEKIPKLANFSENNDNWAQQEDFNNNIIKTEKSEAHFMEGNYSIKTEKTEEQFIEEN